MRPNVPRSYCAPLPCLQVNSCVLGSAAANYGVLAGATSLAVADVARGSGLPTFVYLLKTAAGDLLAGKLDQKEWWAAIGGFLLLLPPALAALQSAGGPLAPLAAILSTLSAPAAAGGFARILPLLFLIQLACELGDARLERWTFFRHRYSFEVGAVRAGGVGGRGALPCSWVVCWRSHTPVELWPV